MQNLPQVIVQLKRKKSKVFYKLWPQKSGFSFPFVKSFLSFAIHTVLSKSNTRNQHFLEDSVCYCIITIIQKPKYEVFVHNLVSIL